MFKSYPVSEDELVNFTLGLIAAKLIGCILDETGVTNWKIYKLIYPFLRYGEDTTHDLAEVLELRRRIERWFRHRPPEAGLRLPRPRLFMFSTGASLVRILSCR